MRGAATLALVAIVSGAACVPDSGRPDRAQRSIDPYRLILDAEDSRPAGGDVLATLVDATELGDPFLRRIAVRALGRLESPGLSGTIARHLGDPDAEVRAVAAEALAQSVHGSDGRGVLDDLLGQVAHESDPAVRGMLARSLGRLTLVEADRPHVEGALVALGGDGRSAPAETLLGVALGFESLVRRADGSGLSRPAADLLVELVTYRTDDGDENAQAAGHIRALAASALGGSRRLSLELVRLALEDPEPEVRRIVIGYLAAVPPSTREGLLQEALSDTSTRVATAAVQYLAALPRTEPRCDQLIAAAGPDVTHAVRIPALAALARPCPTLGRQRASLVQAASELGEPDSAWQPAAQALVSLSRLDPDRSARLLPGYVEHESAFVRAYAARTAAAIRDVEALFTLATDPSQNVRTEAVQGLFAVEGHGLDDFLLEQLDDDDPQLLMTVARLLAGAPDRSRVSRALLSAFERISNEERETWRDARLALLERIEDLGDESLTVRMIPFLQDYDPIVAARVVSLLETWTGGEYVAEPEPLPRVPVLGRAELRELEGATLSLHMRDGGTLVIELFADQATTNVARTVRLARTGYFDGLTFHRWASNFVIQGGSPGANEYQGDGRYTRDEVGGTPHFRGTVGVSTRGRDTGDGQLFINLVDNPRLDYDYTVIGRLVEGYDVLDRVLEGATIERAEVVSER